jgi:hypothetical protein
MPIHDGLVAAVMQIQHQYRIEIDIACLVTYHDFLVTVHSVSQHVDVNVADEELVLPVDDHIVSLLVFEVVVGVDQLDEEAEVAFVLVGDDVDHAVFVVEEDGLDFGDGIFLFDVELDLLFYVYQKTVVFV